MRYKWDRFVYGRGRHERSGELGWMEGVKQSVSSGDGEYVRDVKWCVGGGRETEATGH